MKSFLVKFDQSDLALTEAMPMRDIDEEGEEYPYEDAVLENRRHITKRGRNSLTKCLESLRSMILLIFLLLPG